jgi:hypothetical protein
MDRCAALVRLAADVSAAAAAADWERLDPAVRLLGPQLEKLAAQGPWSAPERHALVLLRAAHEQAMAACAQALGQLGERLEEMSANKAGWIAYALDAATETA